MNSLVPMSIKGLMLDPVSNSPIVVLKDGEDRIYLPIWVGIFEANAIALALRTSAPIFVDQNVLDQAQTINAEDGQEDRMKKWLEDVSPEELGKYKM